MIETVAPPYHQNLFQTFTARLAARPFIAPLALRNAHAMTILGSKRPRRFALNAQPAERRVFRTEAHTTVVAYCHWQPQRLAAPTLLVIHGLEGSAEASYVLGVADKAFAAGFNVLRFNVRNCGGTIHLTPTLYHSGLTTDLHHVTRELIEEDGLPQLFLTGFSMGGNQALKFAGELGAAAPPQLRGVVAISPPIDLEQCSRAIMRRENMIYELRFLRSLRRTLRAKARLFPGVYDITPLKTIRHLWDWDEAYQHHNGFDGARGYYQHASALPHLPNIQVPALIITAQDDPFIPYASFSDARLTGNPNVHLVGTPHGGHVAFCGIKQPDEDRAWAENRAVEFCRLISAGV
ncbi:MAG: alpha/beta fold hydrolase [Acidobacteria bacterium]|nr:alpha/beta fold hydrolase [Acidobacteriota bacterium]MBI3422458.1 alpha/beta fold hydrolase [Acidobacteriota bacterium]